MNTFIIRYLSKVTNHWLVFASLSGVLDDAFTVARETFDRCVGMHPDCKVQLVEFVDNLFPVIWLESIDASINSK